MEYRQKITLEVSGGETVKVAAKQKDKDSRTVEVALTGGGIPLAIPVTVTARLRAIKPSGACVLNDCQIDGDHILVPLTEQLLAEVGTVRADIGLYDGAALLSTTQFVIQVSRSTIDEDAVESTREFSALTNALTAVDTGIAEAATAAENANRAAASLGTAVEDCNTAAQKANGTAALAEEKAADLSNEAWTGEAEEYLTKINGKVYSFPLCIEGRGIIYNKSLRYLCESGDWSGGGRRHCHKSRCQGERSSGPISRQTQRHGKTGCKRKDHTHAHRRRSRCGACQSYA